MSNLLQRCDVLREMLETGQAPAANGETVKVIANIPLSYAEALYQTVLTNKPSVVVEIGMAFGVASLAMLSALRDANGGGRLITIDPMQSTNWFGCGKTAVARAGLADHHELIEDFDYSALPRLLASGTKLDFAYIDGWHTFDYTMIDWWYIDKMLNAGGVVAFNDCNWRAVDRVINLMLTHRKYIEIDVGLPKTYSSKRNLLRLGTFGLFPSLYLRSEDRYFKKTEAWEPDWNFYRPF